MPQKLKYRELPGLFVILRQSSDATIPAWATEGTFTSITRTSDELSIVCPAENIPKDHLPALLWICLKLEGPFPFSQTGVLLSFIEPLSQNSIPIFAISTFDTDYILIPQEHEDRVTALLSEAGHTRME